MKPNLKDFPSGQGVDCADFSIQVNEWKEAFEKQLQENITFLTQLRTQRLASLQGFYSHIPEKPTEAMKEFQHQMTDMIDYMMELEKAIKEILGEEK